MVRAEQGSRQTRVPARRRQRLRRRATALTRVDKRTIALGIAALGAVAAAVIVTVARDRRTSPAHDATAAYITRVDSLQQRMRVDLTKATNAYRDFAGGKIRPELAPELARADRSLRTLEHRLTVTPAPAVAARLKRMLVALAHAEVVLADEVDKLAVFTPRFGALVHSVSVAGAQLTEALNAIKPPKPHTVRGTKKQVAAAQTTFQREAAHAASLQADAVDVYVAEVAHAQSRLRALDPPTVMRPVYRAQEATLASSRRAAESLARELRKADRSRVPEAGRRFTIASRTASRLSAQRAEVAAVERYNARVRAIGSLQARIRAEVARLQRVTA